jgi:hypothetical protein
MASFTIRNYHWAILWIMPYFLLDCHFHTSFNGGCDQSAEDAVDSSMVPDLPFFGGPCCPTLDFVFDFLIDWLIDYLRFYVPLKNLSLIWRRHHSRWRAAKFRPMLGAQGLWAARDLYRATPAVTRNLGFSGLIRRTAPFSRLLWHTRGCGGSDSNPDPHGGDW